MSKEPKGAILVTKHDNGCVETEILFRLSDKHAVDPGGVGYWTTFSGGKKKKKK
jgi:hypothetical protein